MAIKTCMKKLALSIVYFSIVLVKAQTITQVKDTFINHELRDSLFYMDYEQILPYKDSGIVMVGYRDSMPNRPVEVWGLKIVAMDKNLNTLWSTALPFRTTVGETSCTDQDGNVYICYYDRGYYSLAKLNSKGDLVYDKVISDKIASWCGVNNIAVYGKRLILQGSVLYSSTSFAPFVALFGQDGAYLNKKILAKSTASTGYDSEKASRLVVTKENNICFTYQKDISDNYGISCYDSALNLIWEKSFNQHLGYTYNLFRQGNTVTFMEVSYDGSGYITAFIYNSLTGSGGDALSGHYTFNTEYPVLVLPTRDGRYLTLGNSETINGFDLAMDCFDLNTLITAHLCNTNNSRNRISGACMVGNYIYTVTLKFIEQYTSNGSYYRGSPWIRKFSTDFIGRDLDLKPGSELKGVTLYPNPASDECTVSFPEPLSGHLQVYDELGRVLYEVDFKDEKALVVNLPSVTTGLVFVKVNTAEGQFVKPLICQ